MAEFAQNPTGHNAHFGNCHNPWHPDYCPGGSSSGSGAAVAARFIYGALGSDTGGSIRLPASMCGVTGIKGTQTRVSRYGAMPLSFSADNVGPLARTARDCARLLRTIAGHDPADPTSSTEPVADYMLQAAGADNLTPFRFQLNVMNGVDPSPQDVSLETGLLTQHRVKVLVYNLQVTDTLTQSFITAARSAGVPVVGVYETMPTPGFTYQSWMLAEVNALQKAVEDGVSTQSL